MALRPPVVALVLVAALAAGCLSAPALTSKSTGRDAAAPPPAPGANLNVEALSKKTYSVLPKVLQYVPAIDGIRLYAEVYKPAGPGPWPTILINSPYYGLDHGVAGSGDAEFNFRNYFVPRGYAVVAADVRGTGNSEGCLNMMGAKEQRDTYELVEWVANQAWSNGKVGMYGVSYVGTTPHEALIMAPPHLVTVATVAGVTNQWRNTFQNGVPYSGRDYPIVYNAFGAAPPSDVGRGPDWAKNAAAAACEQEQAIHASQPGVYEKGLYDSYWAERNFTAKVKNVKASLFYNQGFTDRAVNPMESVHWYNEIPTPKKAFFGQWPHQEPPRRDWNETLLAWYDHWLKGIDTGIMRTPKVEVVLNNDKIRTGDSWPPLDSTPMTLFLSPSKLVPEKPAAAKANYVQDPYNPGNLDSTALAAVQPMGPTWLNFVSAPLDAETHMAGIPWAHLRASADKPNTYFLLSLYDVSGATWTELTEGWMNAHLWNGFDKSTPLTPGKEYTFQFKFEPREYVFAKGHQIGLRIKGHDGRVLPFDQPMTHNMVSFGGDDPSYIELPILEHPAVFPCAGLCKK
jgi:X-Pro dipeptidyl-peptidase